MRSHQCALLINMTHYQKQLNSVFICLFFIAYHILLSSFSFYLYIHTYVTDPIILLQTYKLISNEFCHFNRCFSSIVHNHCPAGLLLSLVFDQPKGPEESRQDCMHYYFYIDLKEMSAYLLLSGKGVDDMGQPVTCLKKPAFNYWTTQIQVLQTTNSQSLTVYYGFCFTRECTADQLNRGGDIFVDQLLLGTNYTISSFIYYDVNMNSQYTAGSVVACALISLFILFRLGDTFILWGRFCNAETEEHAIQIQMVETRIQVREILDAPSLSKAIQDSTLLKGQGRLSDSPEITHTKQQVEHKLEDKFTENQQLPKKQQCVQTIQENFKKFEDTLDQLQDLLLKDDNKYQKPQSQSSFQLQPQKQSVQIKSMFFHKISFYSSLSHLFQEQQSTKIIGFSFFKIFSIPFITYGYIFYLSNYGSTNYLSFNNQIYSSFCSRLAMFAYYLPDIFFFINGFLLSRKLIGIDCSSQSKIKDMLKLLGMRILKLYPQYLVFILIYWFISPSLHAGPLWVPYLQQIDQCYSNWWRAFLLIDNWFTQGCFTFSWYVQVQCQLTLTLALIFIIYSIKRLAGHILLLVAIIVSLVAVFLTGPGINYSLQTTLSDDSSLYFQAFYAHAFFYLSGTIIALALDIQTVRISLREHFLGKKPVFAGLIVVAFSLLLLIVARPSLWKEELNIELAFCKIGIFVSFLIFFLQSMLNEQKKFSYVHRLSKMSYGVIMAIGLVGVCGFWGLQNFSYTSGMNVLRESVPVILISIPVGIVVQIAFDLTPFVRYYY